MPNQFDVSIEKLEKIDDMPGTWEDQDYHTLLLAIEVDGMEAMQGEELLEMMLMALQDLGAEDAADAVLAYKLQASVSAGVRQNITQGLLEDDDRPWEEYSNIDFHKTLFAVSVLLHKVFPQTFVKPDMMRLNLELKTDQSQARALFSSKPEPAFVTRILADGMDEDSILERLFEDQLASASFPEANGIIWRAEYKNLREDDATVNLVIYSSANWLKPMEDVKTFKSCAYNDNENLEKR